MWDAWAIADVFLITTNATVKQNGCLVMGRGIAREARDRFKNLDYTLGHIIRDMQVVEGRYGLLLPDCWRNPLTRYPDHHMRISVQEQIAERKRRKLGCFQVKYRYNQDASLALISYSSRMLDLFAQMEHPAQVHLNFPGIGNGRLLRQDVIEFIEELPDNVHLWERTR